MSISSQQIVATLEKTPSLNSSISDLQLTKPNDKRAIRKFPLAPFEKVTLETLSYIFELAHGEEVARSFPGDFADRVCPKSKFSIRISHVSVRFRNVAIKTPALWAMIHVQDLQKARLDYIATCLERSGTLPLTIFLNLSLSPIQSSSVLEAMGLVQANTYRLRRLRVMSDSQEMMRPVLRHLNQPAPQLTTLELSIFECCSTPSLSGFMLFGNEMDKLTELRVQYVPISWSQCTFKHLVVFHLCDLESKREDFWGIIRDNTSSLRKLYFHTSLLSDSAPDLQDQYLLNSLEEIHVLDSTVPEDCLELISRIRAPNLRSFFLLQPSPEGFEEPMNRMSEYPPIYPKLTLLVLVDVWMDEKPILRRFKETYPWLRQRVYRHGGEIEEIKLFAAAEDIDNDEENGNRNSGDEGESGSAEESSEAPED